MPPYNIVAWVSDFNNILLAEYMKNPTKWNLRGNKCFAVIIGFITLFPFLILLVQINGYSIFMYIGNKAESLLGLCCADVNIPGYLALGTGLLMAITWLFYMIDACMNPNIKLWKKPLWLFSLFAVNIIAEIFYWVIHIWRPAMNKSGGLKQPDSANNNPQQCS